MNLIWVMALHTKQLSPIKYIVDDEKKGVKSISVGITINAMKGGGENYRSGGGNSGGMGGGMRGGGRGMGGGGTWYGRRRAAIAGKVQILQLHKRQTELLYIRLMLTGTLLNLLINNFLSAWPTFKKFSKEVKFLKLDFLN
ncbi:MAG: hypothetical protein WDM90_25060 [Ferruginibacter sp.]